MTKIHFSKSHVVFLSMAVNCAIGQTYTPENVMFRTNRIGNFEISVFNDGSLFASVHSNSNLSSKWQRTKEYIRLNYIGFGSGLNFGCKVADRKIVSGTFIQMGRQYNFGYKNKFVPGLIGDPNAGVDTTFNGVGWRYLNDPNYITYSSLDYDARGIDKSGSNFPDWTLRNHAGRVVYVHNPLDRINYLPAYQADEALFCIYKDTETRVDPEYRGRYSFPDSSSIPIAIEVRQSVLMWEMPPLNDVIIIRYSIHNKSDNRLQDSFVHFLTWPIIRKSQQVVADTMSYSYYDADPSRNLGYVCNIGLREGNPLSPYLGISLLETPKDPNGIMIGMTRWSEEVYRAFAGRPASHFTDVFRFDSMSVVKLDADRRAIAGFNQPINWSALAGISGFHMLPGDSVTFTVALMVGNGLNNLLRIHDLVRRVYANNFLRPQPPNDPTLSFTPLDGGVHLTWNDAAERSTDIIVPDSLGKPFVGYRLYRARSVEGPYYRIKEWQQGRDSLVHNYLDKGTDGVDPTIPQGSALLNNVGYFYKLTAYDEGAPNLNLESMESNGKIVEARPGARPQRAGDVNEIRVVPNPYIVSHQAQREIDQPVIYFNYLPEECMIRIYTVGLDLVKTIEHHGGATANWDLRTEGGQQVASQLYIAHITTPEGRTAIRKFAVITGE